MWADLSKQLKHFSSVVLTGLDESGYPFSFRCKPESDLSSKILRVKVPDYAGLAQGPAGLLYHLHDEQLWNLKSFIVHGALEQDAQGWVFRPIRITPGMGFGGLLGYINYLRSGKWTAKRYLEKRGLSPPRIPWKRLDAISSQVNKDGKK